MKIYVTGRENLTKLEFEQEYIASLKIYASQGADFIVGDTPGRDTIIQEFLNTKWDKQVTVYHIGKTPRVLVGKFKTKGGFFTEEGRDKLLSEDSDIVFNYGGSK